MVLIIDGNSAIGEHVWSDIDFLQSVQDILFRLRAVTHFILYMCATYSELSSNMNTMFWHTDFFVQSIFILYVQEVFTHLYCKVLYKMVNYFLDL